MVLRALVFSLRVLDIVEALPMGDPKGWSLGVPQPKPLAEKQLQFFCVMVAANNLSLLFIQLQPNLCTHSLYLL